MSERSGPGPRTRTSCTRETAKCDYSTWGPGTVLPPCCTAHLLEVTEYMGDLLERNGITYWLDYGALLGAVRDGALIPWDGDVDLGFLAEDLERVLALAPQIERGGYRIDRTDPPVVRIAYSEANSRHVDLIPWREESGLLVSDDQDPAYQWPGMGGRTAFPRRYVEELTELPLNGRLYPAPAAYHDLLRLHRYGPHYLTPTREIVDSDLRTRLAAADVGGPPELLGLVAERNEHLIELVVAHSRLVRRGFGSAGSGKWKVVAGLPLAPAQRYLDAARQRAQRPSGDDVTNASELVSALAWVEQSIDEFESPPRWLRARRLARRLRWLAAGIARKSSVGS